MCACLPTSVLTAITQETKETGESGEKGRQASQGRKGERGVRGERDTGETWETRDTGETWDRVLAKVWYRGGAPRYSCSQLMIMCGLNLAGSTSMATFQMKPLRLSVSGDSTSSGEGPPAKRKHRIGYSSAWKDAFPWHVPVYADTDGSARGRRVILAYSAVFVNVIKPSHKMAAVPG